MMWPSWRWNCRTVRLPLMPSTLSMRACALLAASLKASWSGESFGSFALGEVVRDGVRRDEVAVGQPLHQRARSEAVRAVIGEVRFAQHEEPGNRALEVVVHPEAAHRVVDGGINPHRNLVGIFGGDPLVHLEQVAVARLDDLDAEPLDGFLEVEIDRQPGLADAECLRRTAAWPRATRRLAARGCRSSGSAARGSSRARLPESDRATACRPSSSEPRRGRRCAATPTSASASTDDRRSPECRSDESA